MSQLQVQEINGKFLYYAFVSGGNAILENQYEINEINVFPVRDKDTGTNLASTVRSVIDNIKPHKSYKKTVNKIAEAALMGARGNSGVIFAQFLYGLSKETKSTHAISLNEFAESLKRSIPYVYEAISNPVEGTILTVIKDWSDFIYKNKTLGKDFKNVLIESLETAEKSLKETTSKLKALNKYGVVDAGAKGFVLFVQGIINFIKQGNIRDLAKSGHQSISLIHTEDVIDEDISFRYCTEAILKNLSIDKADLRKKLADRGDSIVVAGSDDMCRIHVHTDKPAELFHDLKNFSTITFQKVDDMVRQYEVSVKRKWKIAVVTDSTCDLPQELLDHYQINMLPLNLNFGDNHYLDKITVQPEQFYDLLETEEEFPKTSQINERAFTNVYSHLASHYDKIISIHLTGKFSGTYNSSRKAAERIMSEFDTEIFTFDSRNLSGALGLMVLKTAQSIENGETFENIKALLPKWRDEAKIFVSVRDLKYMLKGGRVSGTKGMIAKFLGLNPVISMAPDGTSMLFGKTFSQQSSLKKIFNHISKISKGKKIWNYVVLHAHNEEGAAETAQKMEEITGRKPLSLINISPVIGMHAGLGANAVALLYEN
ncbi:MAG: fatty acid-binding protein DegV [Marinilabiliales bacterium]|nr:MAG: fatty acid-binding protein DegV [Marinilabiliales bacterium]